MSLAARMSAWSRRMRNLPGPLAGGTPPSVSFPAVPLAFLVMIAPGADLAADPATWPWADITSYVRYADGITVTDGRPDEAGQASPSRCVLRVDNRDGRFSRRNPNGTWYGLISKNTPIWVQVDAGTGYRDIYQGYVTEWPTRWDVTTTDATVPIVASGILRRLGQGSDPRSALRRTVEADSVQPDGWWPLEDESRSTQAASAVDGGEPGLVRTDVSFGASGPDGSDGAMSATTPAPVSAATSTSGNLSLTIPTHTVGDETLTFWTYGDPFASPPSGGVQVTVVHRLYFASGGGLGFADIQLLSYDPTGGYSSVIGYWIQFYGPTGAFIDELYTGTPQPTWDPMDGSWHEVQLRMTQSGSDITADVYVDGEVGDTLTMAGLTLTSMSRLTVGSTGYYQDSSNNYLTPYQVTYAISQVMAHSTAPGSYYTAGTGYPGEQAHVRFARLCDEDGVLYTVSGSTGTSVEMGVQPTADLLALLRECETADAGVMHEQGFGLGYQTRAARENAPVALTLAIADGQIHKPFQPTDDDRLTRNRVTARRSDGSWATAKEPDGALGTTTAGLYDDAVTVNVYADTMLDDAAGWRTHLGTVDVERWPDIGLDFAANPELIDTWTSLPYGPRINATGLPTQVAPDSLDVFVEGRDQRLDGHTWTAVAHTSPAIGYDVGTLAATSGDTSDLLGWLEFDTLTLAADVDTTETSWQVTADPVDTTAADDYPRDMRIGGELVTVTACSGASPPQTWTVTRSVNGVVKSHTAGAAITIARPIVPTL